MVHAEIFWLDWKYVLHDDLHSEGEKVHFLYCFGVQLPWKPQKIVQQERACAHLLSKLHVQKLLCMYGI